MTKRCVVVLGGATVFHLTLNLFSLKFKVMFSGALGIPGVIVEENNIM